ncbi:hypothetical protein GWK08_04710 [Leptobacterium flavescens]|uniref:Uncharacterized protein n=1 Tax=Leptobacterium flavescens TaxID=472055 RepID=A0A6P0UHD0_9FLAO|nr:hypothetical protein [Leptobacterium flavescens]NER12731.1 hypothetical protein [Leptobacterium flavescens]
MAIIPLNFSQSSRLKAICLITPTEEIGNSEPVMVLMDMFSNALWYKKSTEIFPFDCLSANYIEQLYAQLRMDKEAFSILNGMTIQEAVEMYTKVAYGDICSKTFIELMN